LIIKKKIILYKLTTEADTDYPLFYTRGIRDSYYFQLSFGMLVFQAFRIAVVVVSSNLMVSLINV